jgi:hypothetical protein
MHWLDQLKLWLTVNGSSASLAVFMIFVFTVLIVTRFA